MIDAAAAGSPRTIANLLARFPDAREAERFEDLLVRPGVRIERIVSMGQASPPDHWYDQAWDEWVLLIAGGARLAIEGEGERELHPGDHLLIPAHVRHRVCWTDPDQPTIWLALHFDEAAA